MQGGKGRPLARYCRQDGAEDRIPVGPIGQGCEQRLLPLPLRSFQDCLVCTLPGFLKVLKLKTSVGIAQPGQVIREGLNLHPSCQHGYLSSSVQSSSHIPSRAAVSSTLSSASVCSWASTGAPARTRRM